MPTIEQKITFRGSPARLFDMYLDSKKHTAATGGNAKLSKKEGGKFFAWNCYIVGKNLTINPNKLIVQTWRGSNWKKSDLDSILILKFTKVKSGGQVHMVHANVPDKYYKDIKKGWNTHYWNPWKKYLR